MTITYINNLDGLCILFLIIILGFITRYLRNEFVKYVHEMEFYVSQFIVHFISETTQCILMKFGTDSLHQIFAYRSKINSTYEG
jgi:hypothetical protein